MQCATRNGRQGRGSHRLPAVWPDSAPPLRIVFARIQTMSKSNDRINLTNQFLIAMPNMADPTFSGTVVYLCDHSERGALGLVINRPTDIDLEALFSRIDLKLEIEPLLHVPVYFGGPVQTERGFVLHTKIVFDVPAEERFEAALALLGISSSMLSGEAGHA